METPYQDSVIRLVKILLVKKGSKVFIDQGKQQKRKHKRDLMSSPKIFIEVQITSDWKGGGILVV